MAVTAELWCVALLIAVAVLAMIPAVRASSHIVYGAMLAVTTIGFIVALSAMAAPSSATVLPLGLPFIGARFRVDALSAFFLLVVDFGAAAACLYGIGYGRHEREPQWSSRSSPRFSPA
jgi:hydrogenase-4 component B